LLFFFFDFFDFDFDFDFFFSDFFDFFFDCFQRVSRFAPSVPSFSSRRESEAKPAANLYLHTD
jgi:hypothetical protein